MNFNQIIGSLGTFETGMGITIFESKLNNFVLANVNNLQYSKEDHIVFFSCENIHIILFSLCAPNKSDDIAYEI